MHGAGILPGDGFSASAPHLAEGTGCVGFTPLQFTDFAKMEIRSPNNATGLFREFLLLMSWTQIFLSHLPGLSNRLLCFHPH